MNKSLACVKNEQVRPPNTIWKHRNHGQSVTKFYKDLAPKLKQ